MTKLRRMSVLILSISFFNFKFVSLLLRAENSPKSLHLQWKLYIIIE